MANPTKSCKECGSEAEVTALASFSGEEGPIAVTVDGMPALVCAKHHKRFLYPGFVPHLMDFVSDPDRIAPQPPAVRRGLLKKQYHCHQCNAVLPATAARHSERVLEASFKQAAPFKVVVRVALYQCRHCGLEQVRSNKELAGNAFKAIAHGFRAADIHPDA